MICECGILIDKTGWNCYLSYLNSQGDNPVQDATYPPDV
jgi:hypothetical protein